MDEKFEMEELHCISRVLYNNLLFVLGEESKVKLRQKMWELRDRFVMCCESSPTYLITSGSVAEGFYFESQDFDEMNVYKTVLVLNENSSHLSTRNEYKIVVTMETENVPPGYTLLKCLSFQEYFTSRDLYLYLSLVNRGSNIYLSSQNLKESTLRGSKFFIHGPCASCTMMGRDLDRAIALKSPFWPRQARSFINRSLRYRWPSLELLVDICRDGCLLVPINSRKQSCKDNSELEWRVSFSLAEKKMIYSMNHCQFLSYGIMKLFLKEVLKVLPEIGELLCSYYMKTAVFWEISESNDEWTPLNFIYRFWNIFRRVMNWISVGYCPNFFIPEHNMFYGKIYGRQQRQLMIRLRSLYDEGYRCLLRCTSLKRNLSIVIESPFVARFVSTNYDDIISLESLKIFMIKQSTCESSYGIDVIVMMRTICNTAAMVPTSPEMLSAIKMRINIILQRLTHVLLLYQGFPNRSASTNRLKYWFVKHAKTILMRSKTHLFQNKILYAIASYKNGNYLETNEISYHIVQQLKKRQQYMYSWYPDHKIIMERIRQGLSYEAILNTCVVETYAYEPANSIEDLYLESETKKHSLGCEALFIPPLVFLHFLLILNSKQLNDLSKMSEVLQKLKTLVINDDGHHILFVSKAISWEILGICQQLCGDYHDAFQSFCNCLRDDLNEFIKATIIRITILIFELLNK